MTTIHNIVLANRSTVVGDDELAAMLPFLQQQADHDFRPFWGVTADLHFVGLKQQPDPAHWPIWVLDRSDIDGDLGYHEDATGKPEAKIFAADDQEYGVSLSITISHELLEMLADPTADLMSADGQYAREVCDPVESDDAGYMIAIGGNTLLVSDFVTPHYFGLVDGVHDPRFDFRNQLPGPCPAMLPGGYIESLQGGQWVQLRARQTDGRHSYRSNRSGRSAYRARLSC